MRRCQTHGTIIATEMARIFHFLVRTDCHPGDGPLASPVIFHLACNLATQTPLSGNRVESFYSLRCWCQMWIKLGRVRKTEGPPGAIWVGPRGACSSARLVVLQAKRSVRCAEQKSGAEIRGEEENMKETIRVSGRRGSRRAILFGALALAGFLFPAGLARRLRAQTPGAAPGQSNAPAQLITLPAEVPSDAARYTVLIAGNKAGLMAVWMTPDGAHHNFFAFNDRGRGPAILTRIVLDRAGMPTEIDASGNDYYKGHVDEHFRMAGSPLRATWNSTAEHGEKQLNAPAFYAPIYAGMVGEMEAALLAATDGRLPLLPDG